METQWASGVSCDMAACEQDLKAALMRDGCRLLQDFVQRRAADFADVRRSGERHYSNRPVTVHSILGDFTLCRDYYYHGDQGRAPLDDWLGLAEGYTPGLQRLMTRAGALSPAYERAGEDLAAYAGLTISGRTIQRWINRLGPQAAQWLQQRSADRITAPLPILTVCCDATGVPMVRRETQGRKGKQTDGSAKTREVKLGCVFTQHGTDEQGQPLRDWNSTSYVASFGEATEVGGLLRNEASLRGLAQAQRVVFIGDGALWIWELARVNFPMAVQILDFYHALEHVTQLAELLVPTEAVAVLRDRWKRWLETDRIERLIRDAQSRLPVRGARRQQARDALRYFQANRVRMQYATFRQQGFFVGSGVVEAGCKTLVGQRTKQSGMFWRVSGAQNVLSLRTLALNPALFDRFWTSSKRLCA